MEDIILILVCRHAGLDLALLLLLSLNQPNQTKTTTGVHITYEDLYDTVLFFIAIYVSGQIASYIKMPALVGEIVCGILLGPPLADFVPNPEAFVLLGEIG